ncbi:MAG: hypothetical protein AAF629_15475 [Chloroflexota bacterium]
MKTAIYTSKNYQQKTAAKQTNISIENEVTFVPTLVDLQTPVKKGFTVFQLRRQVSAFLEGIVSGAASFR